MSARGKEFIGLLPAEEKQPKSHFFGKGGGLKFVQDNFELQTWISVGALLQGLLFLAIGRLSLVPVVLYLVYSLLNTYAMVIGLKRDTYQDGVIHKKHSAVFPDEVGKFGNKPSNQDLVVFHIGTQYNHPLGLFAPYVARIGSFFSQMVSDLEAHADEFGYLGSSSYISTHETSKNEIMVCCYFRNVEGLHRFAHSEYHLPQWQEWNRTVSKLDHISIFHETYHVPAGNWESIHVNSKLSGINATVFKVAEEGTGKEVYIHPVVDASKGLLKTSAGRMARSQGHEHEKLLEVDPYDKKEN